MSCHANVYTCAFMNNQGVIRIRNIRMLGLIFTDLRESAVYLGLFWPPAFPHRFRPGTKAQRQSVFGRSASSGRLNPLDGGPSGSAESLGIGRRRG